MSSWYPLTCISYSFKSVIKKYSRKQTHAYVDLLGDAPVLVKMNNTKLYGPADMVTLLTTLGILPVDLVHRFNKIDCATPLPGIKVTAVQAEYS